MPNKYVVGQPTPDDFPANAAQGFPRRNSDNTGWEQVAFDHTLIATALQPLNLLDADCTDASGTDLANAGTITAGAGFKTFAIAAATNGGWPHGSMNAPVRWYNLPRGDFLLSDYCAHQQVGANDTRGAILGMYSTLDTDIWARCFRWIASTNKGTAAEYDLNVSLVQPATPTDALTAAWVGIIRRGGVLYYVHNTVNASNDEPTLNEWTVVYTYSPAGFILSACDRAFVGAANVNSIITEVRWSSVRLQKMD